MEGLIHGEAYFGNFTICRSFSSNNNLPSVPFEMVEESVTMRVLTGSQSPPTRPQSEREGTSKRIPSGNKIDALLVARRMVTKQLLNMPSLQ